MDEKGAVDFRLVEDRLDFGNAGQDVVARVAFLDKDFVGLPVDFLVELGRKVDLDRYKPVRDEFLHFCVVEEVFRVRHSTSLRIDGEQGQGVVAFLRLNNRKKYGHGIYASRDYSAASSGRARDARDRHTSSSFSGDNCCFFQ